MKAEEIKQLIADAKAESAAYVIQVVNNYDNLINARLTHLDEIVENHEKAFAALMQGYMEATALVQAMMAHMMNDTPEKAAEFQRHIQESRNTYMENLTYAARLSQSSVDHFTPYAPDDVEQHQSHQESK